MIDGGVSYIHGEDGGEDGYACSGEDVNHGLWVDPGQ